MEHYQRVSHDAPPHGELGVRFEVGLLGLAHTYIGCPP